MNNKNMTSKYLSLILRHKPEIVDLTLDKHGWSDIDALLLTLNNHGIKVTLQMIKHIIETDDKDRFTISNDNKKIRASQGHPIDIELVQIKPPNILYHGTAVKYLELIWDNGILKQTRNHVHLSANIECAKKVGRRHGVPKVLLINSLNMYNDNIKFYLTNDNVWLTDYVALKYIEAII